jgi:hypothetical protein
MADLARSDWPGYFRSLPDDDACALAIWLAAKGLDVGEFMEVVDRAYAAAPAHWDGQWQRYVAQFGRLAANAYARRKRRFAGLMATLEEALISGALPGDVAPQELRASALPWTKRRQPEELLCALERVRRGQA